MSRFKTLKDFERRFPTMSIEELKRWKKYWAYHAQGLPPKIGKESIKRLQDIEKAIERKSENE